MKSFNFLGFFLIFALIFSACKSEPAPLVQEQPLAFPPPALIFQNITADNPDHLSLFFTLEMEGHLSLAEFAKIESWHVEINRQKAASGFNIDFPKAAPNGIFYLETAARQSLPIKLNMDIPALAVHGLAPADYYNLSLVMELSFSNTAEKFKVSAFAAFPGVQPPLFDITGIAILRAELINTWFRVGLRIDNPNSFPVDLSAFRYVLYGNNRFWADGALEDIISVPGNSSVTGNIFLQMNFIDMDRSLLDQIIALADVNYRFTGEAQVNTGIEHFPRFNTNFDLSGYSQVLER